MSQSISLMKCSPSVEQGETEAAPPEQPRETCGSEYSVWPADIFKSKTLQRFALVGIFAQPLSGGGNNRRISGAERKSMSRSIV